MRRYPGNGTLFGRAPQSDDARLSGSFPRGMSAVLQLLHDLRRSVSRSRKMADILAEVRNLEEANFQELILTGTHIGAYGEEDGNEGYDLAYLARTLANSSIPRLRLGSIEPTEVTDKLLQLMVEIGGCAVSCICLFKAARTRC